MHYLLCGRELCMQPQHTRFILFYHHSRGTVTLLLSLHVMIYISERRFMRMGRVRKVA